MASARSRCSSSCSARSSEPPNDGAVCASRSSNSDRSPLSEKNSTTNIMLQSRRWPGQPSPEFPANPSLDRALSDSLRVLGAENFSMRGDPGFFDIEVRLGELSAKGDDLERLKGIVDFEIFRADLERAVPRADRAKGGRPPYDHVLMFKILILQSSHSLSDERTEYLIKDRLSFMRFLGLSLAQSVPDANSIWNFREALTQATIEGKPAIEALFRRF